ncbi:MAG: UDP-glucose/GDP-mannose dehydrogenase dimerization [Parcubacteria group bacterium GW2011_GWA2_51_10]|nr:MAG: UDP-glucose/GDP-mannose dehydrogenase dimerization [Parcubacteria group bacterium GW2011_GWA2_51_10]
MRKWKPKIGFVGQGYVGGSYANNFEKRGFKIVRYSLERKWIGNKERIRECDIVFVCVPTPTTPKGFDVSIVEKGLSLVGKGKIAVIKSTMQPGTTKRLQKRFPTRIILCSPEFLSVTTAQEDADNPFSNIIGMPLKSVKHKSAAKLVHAVLPKAPFSLTCDSNEAELVKYAHNMSGYTQVLTFNLIYDMAQRLGSSWEPIRKATKADPMICNRYANPVHKSGRGAGGACFIKDMAAFARLYEKVVGRPEGVAFLKAAQKNNIALLAETGKDLALLKEVYGGGVLKKRKKTRTRR